MDEPEWNAYLNQYANLDATHFTKIPKTTDKYCVIIEPRCHSHLISVIKNFMFLLQEHNWGFIIFHGINNADYIHEHLSGWNNIHYVKINTENMDINQYNELLCSTQYWEILEQFGCKHALLFQIDTILLKSNIDDFLQYDYVGAPWCVKWLNCLEVGNGGLSLRNVQTMKMLTQKYPKYNMNEDIWFSLMLLEEQKVNANIKIPTIDIATQFSVETIFYEDPCGMHKPHLDKFKSREEFVRILSKRYVG
jgi:hypothetical protein